MVENLERNALNAAINKTRESFDTDNPIIPFIEGDGIGVDITPAMIDVVNNAVEKAYEGTKKIEWMEVYCGEKSTNVYSKDT